MRVLLVSNTCMSHSDGHLPSPTSWVAPEHPSDRQAAGRQLGLDGFLVGYVGRLVEKKGLFDLVDAMADCPPHVHLALVGAGPAGEALTIRARTGYGRGFICSGVALARSSQHS